MGRYEVKARVHEVFGPLFFYVHDSQDSAPETMAPGTGTYSAEEAAQEVAYRLNTAPAVERSGRNGLTTYDAMEA